MMRKKISYRLAVLPVIFLVLSSFLYNPAEATAPDKPNITFAVMSDIHIHDKNTDVHRRMLRALGDYWRINAEMNLMVINGDLTNGFPSHYKTLRRLLKSVPHPPLHFTPGNHDFYKMNFNRNGEKDFKHLPNGWSSEQAMELFEQFTGYDKPYHDTWVNGYHFIFLADEKSRDFDRSIGMNGYISEQQLSWLKEKLNERSTGSKKPTFVFFHHPLPNTLPGSEHHINIVQHRMLRGILNEHPEVIFFSGHTHYNFRETDQRYYDRFLMLGSSSVMRNEESLYIEVYDDYVNIHSRDHRRGEWIPNKSYRYTL